MNGLLLVDKPQGLTSHDVVARVRRAAGEKSIGHLGTLDPMATGLLPLLLGKWTRLAKFYGSLEKTYTGVIRFGFATDTFDAEGEPVGAPVPVHLHRNELEELAATFLGESEQMPPAFSAKKIGGRPAYELARAGQVPQLRPARIAIGEFSLCEPEGSDVAFRLTISSGGYVRSVAHSMGQQLGCGAHLAALRRVAVGPMLLRDARSLAAVEEEAASGTLAASLPHAREILPELPAVTADETTLQRIHHGGQVALPEFSRAPVVKVFRGRDELVAIATRLAGVLFQPSVVLT